MEILYLGKRYIDKETINIHKKNKLCNNVDLIQLRAIYSYTVLLMAL